MPTLIKRPDNITERQKMILASLQQGHKGTLQVSPLSGGFTGYVRVFNVARNVDELIPWGSVLAMIRRGFVRLDGDSLQTSTSIVLCVKPAEGV
ncbi:hypothetical protein [Cupriavidus agavae]|uniref:Uncharacterized protein n=1 Tax=Cupriavidus agavae TaxID=1001822 RepID=A0A4Q7RT13_9BURK|nr:hypothetical protein [Cupriavidus agavae]RZT35492.1 hypothetical protein EV147_3941 [Cupriavidus agavae]